MLKIRHIFATILASWLVSTATVFAAEDTAKDAPRDPYKFFFNETWGDFKEELAKAKAQGKEA